MPNNNPRGDNQYKNAPNKDQQQQPQRGGDNKVRNDTQQDRQNAAGKPRSDDDRSSNR